MNRLITWIQQTWGLSPESQGHLVASVAIVFFLWLARRIVVHLVTRRTEDVRFQYQWKKVSAYVTVFLGALLIGGVWFEGVGPLTTYLGLVSAGLAIALKDLVVDFVGWGFILWRRPFEVGDRIEIGDHAGDVIDQRIFQFTLLEIGNWVHADQSTGRVIHIPNGWIFNQTLANFTRGFEFIWNEIPVLVTFESDWEKAKAMLLPIAQKHSEHLSRTAEEQIKKAARKYMIFYSKLSPIVYTSVEDCGVLLTIRYICAPRNRRSSAEHIWEDVLREFAQCEDIDFAYPTQRFYDNLQEGKPGKQPPPTPSRSAGQ